MIIRDMKPATVALVLLLLSSVLVNSRRLRVGLALGEPRL